MGRHGEDPIIEQGISDFPTTERDELNIRANGVEGFFLVCGGIGAIILLTIINEAAITNAINSLKAHFGP